MDIVSNRGFYAFIKKEEKEYVCAKCGSYTMKVSKMEKVSDYEVEAKVKCIHCDHERNTSFTYYGD